MSCNDQLFLISALIVFWSEIVIFVFSFRNFFVCYVSFASNRFSSFLVNNIFRSKFQHVIYLYNSFFFRKYLRRNSHPKMYKGMFGELQNLNVYNILVLFLLCHFSVALFSLNFFEVMDQGGEVVGFYKKIYFSFIIQLSPGFTEFLPVNVFSRSVIVLQSFLGVLINTFFLSLAFLKVIHPRNVFSIAPVVLFDPVSQELVFRVYSKYPEPVYNIKFDLFRFNTYEQSGQIIGNSEKIDITHSREFILPYYGLLLRVNVGSKEISWSDITQNGSVRDFIPFNWLGRSEENKGHYYLVVSAEVSSGKSFQSEMFDLFGGGFDCGRHMLMNDGIKLEIDEWTNYKRYNWDSWGRWKSPECEKCSLPRCINNRVSYDKNSS